MANKAKNDRLFNADGIRDADFDGEGYEAWKDGDKLWICLDLAADNGRTGGGNRCIATTRGAVGIPGAPVKGTKVSLNCYAKQ
jgi:hypothetical protein